MHYHHHAVGHMVASAIIHGVIYGAIWKILRHLSAPEALLLAAVMVVVLILMRGLTRRLMQLGGLAVLLGIFYLAHHREALQNFLHGEPAYATLASISTFRPETADGPVPGLPNPSLTPGALNPDVTQADIDRTICVPGWTRTVRPPESYTERLKRRQIREYGYAQRRLGDYEEDHFVSLELGGSPEAPGNLWPEPHEVAGGWGSFAKDRLENRLHRLVCERRLTLREAQTAISTNWIAAYKRYIGPTPNNHHG